MRGDSNPPVKHNAWRGGLWAGCFAALFLAFGWSAYWYVAQHMAWREFHVQLEREAQFGRIWSCDSLTSGGYPFAIALDCLRPKLRTEEEATAIRVSAKRALIHARLYTPKLVEIELSAPASLEVNGTTASLDWSNLQISARGLPERLDRLSIVGRDLTATVADLPPSTVETLHFHLKRTAPTSFAPYSITAGLAGVNSSVLATYLGPRGPALLTALGAVSQLDAANVGQWAERAEAWRIAGGRISIAALSLTTGDFAAQAEGSIGLDQMHRPDGELSVNLRNAGPIVLAILESAGKVQRNTIGGRLAAGVLGKGDLRLDMSAEGGALSIGPLRRAFPLPPLY